MVRPLDLVGHVFGRLTVLSRAPANRWGRTQWVCACTCGNQTVVDRGNLRSGATQSCGCTHKEMLSKRNYRHGHAARKQKDPTYSSWMSMKNRCLNSRSNKHSRYKDVSIHPRWLEYSAFLEDMGPRPEGTSLDRIDPFRGYEPGNCRWANAVVQAFNQRRHHLPTEQRSGAV